MWRLRLFAVIITLALLVTPLVVLASDLSSAIFSGVITISNNGTAVTNAVATLSLNSQSLIDVYGVDTAFDRIAVRNSSGADVPTGISVNSTYPWCFFMPTLGAYASTNLILYTGNDSMNFTKYYFPGPTGMTVAANTSLNIGNSGNYTISGWFNPDSTGYLLNIPNVISVNGTGTGIVTVIIPSSGTDTFTSDYWTDVGVGVGANVSSSRMEWDTTNDAESSYKATSTFSDTTWTANFTYRATTAGAGAISGFGVIDSPNGDYGTLGTHDAIFVMINNLDIYARSWDGGAMATSGTITILLNTTYYITLERTAANSISVSVFTDAARTTHIAGSPQSLVIPATVVGLKTLEVAGYDGGARSVGWLDDLSYSLSGASVSSPVIPAGERIFQIGLNAGFLTIKVDSSANTSVAFSGNITAATSNLTWVSGNITPYVNRILVIKGGVTTGNWTWEYATTFSDQSGHGNTATPSFRTTSSDPDITAALISFSPLDTAIAPPFSVSTPPLFYTSNITISGNFSSSNVSSPGSGPPGVGLIEDAAAASDTPLPWIWGILAMTTIAFSSFGVDYMQKKYGFRSLWPKIFIGVIVIGLLITFGKFDWWMIILYGLIVLAIAIGSRHTDVGGNVSQHGLIGFLAMAWIGLTIINRIIEGQFITSAEQTWSNYYAFTQEFRLFDIFSLPVINLDFFTHGIPSLIRWDYSFFGGNAQMIQYLLYSITAVVSFIIFLAIVPLVYNFFKSIL